MAVTGSAAIYHRGKTYPVSPIPDPVLVMLLQSGTTKYNVRKLKEICKPWFHSHKGIRREAFWIARYVSYLLISTGGKGVNNHQLSENR